MTVPLQVLVCISSHSVHCVERALSGSGITKVSRNGMYLLAAVSSTVNCMHVSMLFRCSRNLSLSADINTTNVSSPYLFQTLGGFSAEIMASISKSSA